MTKEESPMAGQWNRGRTGRNQMTEEKKVRIILNDRSYEYDVYTLVIAFFQGIQGG